MREFQHWHKVWLLRGVKTLSGHSACITQKAVPVKSLLLHKNAASARFQLLTIPLRLSAPPIFRSRVVVSDADEKHCAIKLDIYSLVIGVSRSHLIRNDVIQHYYFLRSVNGRWHGYNRAMPYRDG